MKLTEDTLRRIVREEIKQTLNEAGEAKPTGWDGVPHMLDKRDGIFMSLHRDDYITVSLGRATLDIPVDKSRKPYFG